MNKKGQVHSILLTFSISIICGLVLGLSSPIIDSFRINLLNDPLTGLFVKLIMYALFPLLWSLWLIITILSVKASMRRQE